MHVSFLFNALTLSLLVGANPLPRIQRRGAALPPKYTVNELDGFANQTSFPQVYRDNGGGGNINGVNIVVFSDTSVTADGAGRFGPLEHFVSNSVAVMEYTDPSNPLELFNFGSDGVPTEFVPRQANETDGSQFCIWPNANIVGDLNVPGTGLAVYPVSHRIPTDGGGELLYNTLVKITMTAYGPVAERLVPQLFYANELQYGSFGMVKLIDDNIYLFAAVNQPAPGLKVARVAEADVADRSKYTYWDGSEWAATPPAAGDAKSNFINYSGSFGWGPASGNIYWNTFYQCWVAVFFDAFVDGTFRLMYSTTIDLVGPWSAEQDLYQTVAEPGSYNYAGHAYPDLGNGNSLLLSWTYGTNLTKMAEVTFA